MTQSRAMSRGHLQGVVLTTVFYRAPRVLEKTGQWFRPSSEWVERVADDAMLAGDSSDTIDVIERAFLLAEQSPAFRCQADEGVWDREICEAA